VRRNRSQGLWLATIKYKRKQYTLGHFSREEQAALAYDKAAWQVGHVLFF
jgi:hypothetical protein